MITVATFYRFVPLDPDAFRPALLAECERLGIRGIILLANEGLNATVAGTTDAIDALLAYLRADERFSGLTPTLSTTDTMPFQRMKVRIKREIVRMGVPEVDPNDRVGTYVPPEQWNALISEDDVALIDTRNDFEVKAGAFEGAINPETQAFGEFPDWVQRALDPAKHKRVAMYCTGGIRCEKATSYLLDQGFEEVYHLKGGILKYLEQVDPEQSRWNGECFVFDERVTVGHGLRPGDAAVCPGCNQVVPASGACPNCPSDDLSAA